MAQTFKIIDGRLKSMPSSTYSQYLEDSIIKGIDPSFTNFPKIREEDYKKRYKNENTRLFVYVNRVLKQLSVLFETSQMAYLLFDKYGYIIHGYGNEELLRDVSSEGIEKYTIWTYDDMGPNAVTIGLKDNLTISTVGEDNYLDLLKKYAIYFSPVTVNNGSNIENYGGIALLMPSKVESPDYLQIVFAIANDVILHFSTGNTIFTLYEHSDRGVIIFDIDMKTNKSYTSYHSNNIFDILSIPEIPKSELYFRPAELFLDPLPKNQEAWSIINDLQNVENKDITLSVRGKEINCLVTTQVQNQPSLYTRNVRFYITSERKSINEMSKKVGNRALRTFDDIIANSKKMKSIIKKGKIMANTDCNIMILGESGTGKDILAQAVHNASDRNDKPFIAVNCGALPRDLIASELFGYESGAFTGAKKKGNIGKFELANEGTIFLDEIGELPLDLQATLLRVVEQKSFMRLGGTKQIEVDVKIISATNANIMEMIKQKRFREDLYYRLNTMCINLPPLRERKEDIIPLCEHFIAAISKKIGSNTIKTLSDEAKALLEDLPWYGNIRELQNMIEGVVQLYTDERIEKSHILDYMDMQNLTQYTSATRYASDLNNERSTDKKELTDEMIEDALLECNGNRSSAAKYLGVSRSTLYRYMKNMKN